MGNRTPGLLHAMQLRSDHSSPLPFTADTADLPVRSQQAAAVHGSSRRTVTNLVTSRPGTTAPARRTTARCRPPAGLTGAPIRATPEPAAGRHSSAVTRAAGSARIGQDAVEAHRGYGRGPGAARPCRAVHATGGAPHSRRTEARHTTPATAAPGSDGQACTTDRRTACDSACARYRTAAGHPRITQPIAAEADR
jgi:hypothetical protein